MASQKSFEIKGKRSTPKLDDPDNPTVDFHGEKRTHDKPEYTTDLEARFYRKAAGKEAKLSFLEPPKRNNPDLSSTTNWQLLSDNPIVLTFVCITIDRWRFR